MRSRLGLPAGRASGWRLGGARALASGSRGRRAGAGRAVRRRARATTRAGGGSARAEAGAASGARPSEARVSRCCCSSRVWKVRWVRSWPSRNCRCSWAVCSPSFWSATQVLLGRAEGLRRAAPGSLEPSRDERIGRPRDAGRAVRRACRRRARCGRAVADRGSPFAVGRGAGPRDGCGSGRRCHGRVGTGVDFGVGAGRCRDLGGTGPVGSAWASGRRSPRRP